MKYIDLFGGIGGFSLAIKRKHPEWKCVGYYDKDKYAVATYNKNFGTKHEPTDIKQISAEQIPKHDILCGGFPCQSFSLAGKRRGFEDTRGTLFFDICRIAKYHRTPLLLLENVKGLLSHDEGKTFETIIKSLAELGYDIQWQVLNSKHFGVPQNRERVFIIANLRGTPRPKIFPITWHDEKNRKGLRKEHSICQTITTRTGNTARQQTIISHSPRTGDPEKGGTGMLTSDEHCFTLDSSPHYVIPDISPCLCAEGMQTSSRDTAKKLIKQGMIRRLTPTECERLQGFPDDWTIGSDTQRYKQCGNAITVKVVEAIIERLAT